MSVETMAAFVAGVLIPLLVTLLGRESVGRWPLAGEQRETSALETLTRVVLESIEGWRRADGAYIQLVETLRGIQTEQKYYYQDLRDRAVEREERMVRIEELLSSLTAILAQK